MRHLRRAAALAAIACAALLSPVAPATGRVPAIAASWTPAVTSPDATARELAQCGSTMYAVGSFT